MDVVRKNLFCQCHRNLSITFLCPIKTVRKGSTMCLSFITCTFTAIEWKGSKNRHIDIMIDYFAIPRNDTQIKEF